MVVGEVVNVSTELFSRLGQIALFLQALGIVIVLWLIFQIVNLIVNRKNRKKIYAIEDKIDSLNNKVDRLLKNKK